MIRTRNLPFAAATGRVAGVAPRLAGPSSVGLAAATPATASSATTSPADSDSRGGDQPDPAGGAAGAAAVSSAIFSSVAGVAETGDVASLMIGSLAARAGGGVSEGRRDRRRSTR